MRPGSQEINRHGGRARRGHDGAMHPFGWRVRLEDLPARQEPGAHRPPEDLTAPGNGLIEAA